MSRTFIRQATQIRKSDLFDDAVVSGSTMESAAVHVEDDLNNLRSQVKRAFWADSVGKWYDDVSTVNGKKRGLNTLSTDLNTAEEHRFLFRAQMLTDITVPAGQNYKILSVASAEAPSVAAAVGAGTYEGAIVAVLTAGQIGSHQLTSVAGPDAISPKNLLLVRDASTGDPIMSNNKVVYAILQAEVGVADGDSFDDVSKRVQVSFVRENATGDGLEAVPVVDIQNKVFNYSYVRRLSYTNLPETSFLTGVFLDNLPVGTTPTLDIVIDNQVGAASQSDRDIEWRITDTYSFSFETSDGGVELFKVSPTASGDTISMTMDTLDINNTNTVDVLNGVAVDTGGTTINLGVTAGQIDSAGALTVASAAASDLTLNAGGEIVLVDSNKAGSTYSGNFLLSDTSTEWSNFETTYGEVSLLNALVQAASKENRQKTVAVLTANVNADTDVTGAGGTPNLDAQLGDYSGVTFLSDVDVYLNGVLLRNGADAAANHDVYPGTAPATGDLKFEFKVKTGDVVTMVIYGTSA